MLKLRGLRPGVRILFVILLSGYSGTSLADMIQVKGKTYLNGTIVSQNDKELVFEKAFGGENETYALSDVKVIKRDHKAKPPSRTGPEPGSEATYVMQEDPDVMMHRQMMQQNSQMMNQLQSAIASAQGAMPSASGGAVGGGAMMAQAQQMQQQAMQMQQMRMQQTQRAIAEMEEGDAPLPPTAYQPLSQTEDDSYPADEHKGDYYPSD